MSYQKQAWRDYDDTKTELQNMQNGAVVTPERLNHIETGIANSAERAELEQTKQEVTAQLAQTESRMNTFTELAEGSTTGDAELMDMRVLANGKVTTNAGDALRKTQTGEALQPKSITSDKLADIEYGQNIYNRDNAQVGKAMAALGDISDNASYELSKYSVQGGEVYTGSNARSTTAVLFTSTGVHSSLIVPGSEIGKPFTITIPEEVTEMYLNVYIPYVSDYMLVKGSVLPETYIPYYTKLKNFRVNEESVGLEELTVEVRNHLTGALNQWKDKSVITFGDSITWYDGKPFSSTHIEFGETAVGYQTYLRDELGIEVDNQGVSGNHMGQIANIIKGYDLSDIDALTITSGANDWSQERAIGEIQVPMSEFNESTFYGALQSAVESVLARKPTVKIILITPIRGYHPTNTHNGEWLDKGVTVDDMLEQPDDYARAFKEVADLYGLETVDFRDKTGMNFYNYEQYMGDTGGKKVHPTNEYFKKMGKYIVEEFKVISI